MKRLYLFLFTIFICINNTLAFQQSWPANIDKIIESTCVIEYYQPQNERTDVKDKIRIKKYLTGVLVSNNGLVLTNEEIYPANLDISSSSFNFYHSQHLPEDITVKFNEDKKLKATFLGKDEQTKLAFLKIDKAQKLPAHTQFEEFNSFKIGQPLFLVERLRKKYDFEPIVTKVNINSIIQKPRKKLIVNSNLNVLSNGGLVLDETGNAIGLIQNNRQNYGYQDDLIESQANIVEILLADDFNKLIDSPPILSEMKNGSGKSWLGIQMQVLTKDMANYWGIENVSGVIINKIVPDSPSDQAGLKIGDIIISINDFKLTGDDKKNLDIFRNYVRNLAEKNTEVKYIRDNETKTARLQLRSAPKSQFLAEEKIVEELGFNVKELTQDIFLNYNIDFDTEGVWVSQVESAGIANIAGLRVGDLILRINDKSISDISKFDNYLKGILNTSPEYIKFFILRNNKTQFLFLKITKSSN